VEYLRARTQVVVGVFQVVLYQLLGDLLFLHQSCERGKDVGEGLHGGGDGLEVLALGPVVLSKQQRLGGTNVVGGLERDRGGRGDRGDRGGRGGRGGGARGRRWSQAVEGGRRGQLVDCFADVVFLAGNLLVVRHKRRKIGGEVVQGHSQAVAAAAHVVEESRVVWAMGRVACDV
jgi:hypothetical protein